MILTGLLLPVMKKISPRLGMLVCGLLFFLTYGISEPEHTMVFGLVHLPAALFRTNWLMPLGFFNSSFRSADYFALIPWFFLFLLGAFAGTMCGTAVCRHLFTAATAGCCVGWGATACGSIWVIRWCSMPSFS